MPSLAPLVESLRALCGDCRGELVRGNKILKDQVRMLEGRIRDLESKMRGLYGG